MSYTREELEKLSSSVPFWFHSIDLGQGVRTPGHKHAKLIETELNNLKLPDLKGKSVLDIGAWDGFYSFTAEQRGARRVVALDHMVWSTEIVPYGEYCQACVSQGKVPLPFEQSPHWKPAQLPGKAGFDIAHKVLGSRVEPLVSAFMDMDLSMLGKFDVVLYLGVLYHIENPLLALRRLASVVTEVAVIET